MSSSCRRDAGSAAAAAPATTGTAASGSASETPAVPGAAGGAPGRPLDLDRLLEALEDHVLRELERRGGRFEGMF